MNFLKNFGGILLTTVALVAAIAAVSYISQLVVAATGLVALGPVTVVILTALAGATLITLVD